VTPYAAGCALCGADLDPRRWQRRPTLGQRMIARLPARWRLSKALRRRMAPVEIAYIRRR